MAGAELVVSTNVWIVGRDIDVPDMLTSIHTCANKRLEHVDMSAEKHISVSHDVGHNAQVKPLAVSCHCVLVLPHRVKLALFP
jgi:hypothetical protein